MAAVTRHRHSNVISVKMPGNWSRPPPRSHTALSATALLCRVSRGKQIKRDGYEAIQEQLLLHRRHPLLGERRPGLGRWNATIKPRFQKRSEPRRDREAV